MTALTKPQTAKLARLEGVIAEGLQSFIDVGAALAEVRDSGLWAEHADSFEAYCSTRWGLSRSRSYQIIDAAQVVSAIADSDPKAPVPANVEQARALTPIKDDPPAMASAMKTAARNGQPTAKTIGEAVDDIRPPAPRPSADERRRDRTTMEVTKLVDRLDFIEKIAPADFPPEDLRVLMNASTRIGTLVGKVKAQQRKTRTT